MNNPFLEIEKKLNSIESLLLDLKDQPQQVEQTEPQDQLLTIDEAAEFLHLTKPTIYSKHSKGEIPGVCKIGKRLYISKKSLTEWILSTQKKTHAEIEAEADDYINKKRRNSQ